MSPEIIQLGVGGALVILVSDRMITLVRTMRNGNGKQNGHMTIKECERLHTERDKRLDERFESIGKRLENIDKKIDNFLEKT